jgi:hypothetical protein
MGLFLELCHSSHMGWYWRGGSAARTHRNPLGKHADVPPQAALEDSERGIVVRTAVSGG